MKTSQRSILFLFQLICFGFCHWSLLDQKRLPCIKNSTPLMAEWDPHAPFYKNHSQDTSAFPIFLS